MPAALKIVLNRKGVGELLRAKGVRAELERRTRKIAQQADANAGTPGGHRVAVEIGPHRARAVVITESNEAVHAEATTRSLTRAFEAGRVS